MDTITRGSKVAGGPYMSARAKRQQVWITVHRWLGLILLIPMAVLGVTGSAQVWPEETEALMNPAREVAASADPVAIDLDHVAAAREAAAEYGQLTALEFGAVGEPLVARTTSYAPPLLGIGGPVSQILYIDPDSAQVIDDKPSSGDFQWYMHFVHGLFLIPGWGRQAVGWMGWFLVISSITGIVVFWPGRKKVLAALKWRKHEGKAMNLHRQSGFILSLVLIVEAISGAWISFPQAMAMLVEPGVEQPERPRRGPPPGGDAEPLAVEDSAWLIALADAQASYPGRPTRIGVPMGEDGAWSVGISGDAMDATVTVPTTPDAAVTFEERPQMSGPPPATTRAGAISMFMRQVHYALIGGIVWEILVFLSGIALTFLALSGIYTWGLRKAGKRR